jgi:hypothetical protein
MPNLQKLTLVHNKDKQRWVLNVDKTDKTLKTFRTKEEATKSGVLRSLAGKDGASVKIKKLNSEIQEERTYPRKKDPVKSKG